MENRLIYSIVTTIAYASVFDYPLTISQLRRYLLSSKRVSKHELSRALKNETIFSIIGNYIVFPDQEYLIALRKARAVSSKKKLKIAKRAARILERIPFVKLIGVSGSVSVLNADESDDIDFFIIARHNTVWITRFLVILVLKIHGLKRERGAHYTQDKICANMFMDENSLAFSKREHNMFIAHEIVQLMPLVNKSHTYQRLLSENAWVKSMMANITIPHFSPVRSSFTTHLFSNVLQPIDRVVFKLQFLYMKRRITKEHIEPNQARFHPNDRKRFILESFNRNSKKYIRFFSDSKQSKNMQNNQETYRIRDYSRILTG